MENKNLSDKEPKKAPKETKRNMFKFNLYWMYGLIFIMLVGLYVSNGASNSQEMNWTEFQSLARENAFSKITVFDKTKVVEATIKEDKRSLVLKDDSTKEIGRAHV